MLQFTVVLADREVVKFETTAPNAIHGNVCKKELFASVEGSDAKSMLFVAGSLRTAVHFKGPTCRLGRGLLRLLTRGVLQSRLGTCLGG